ncbi:hypothetical protein ACET60_05725 [Aeromonas veronii]
MNFSKTQLAAFISSALLASAAHAVMSDPTPKVVGHKPVIEFTGNKPVNIKLGDIITLTDTDFTFTDADYDAEGERTYAWKLGEVETGITGLSYNIGLGETEKVDQELTLVVTPKTTGGDPAEGDTLVVSFGVIGVDATAAPIISELTMGGGLQLGQNLSATYAFNPNGGDLTDKSTYVWGRVGTTASSVAGGNVVSAPQTVDNYLLTSTDVGEVVELSVQAKNNLGIVGNIETVTSSSLPDGGSGGEVVNPTEFAVRIAFTSTASDSVNGVGSAGRPVAGKDVMAAECKYVAAPVEDFAACDATPSAPYSLEWMGTTDGATYNPLGNEGATYMPQGAHQGQRIAVKLTAK